MTDEQIRDINEKISAWFEPKPSIASDEDGPYSSPQGAWYRGSRMDDWSTLDYFHSEDANAKLLEALKARNPVLRFVEAPIDAWVVYLWTAGQPVSDGIPMTNVSLADCSRSPDRKTAVVLAFLKFAGIEVTTS